MNVISRLPLRLLACGAMLLGTAWTCAAQATPPTAGPTPTTEGSEEAPSGKAEETSQQTPASSAPDGFKVGAFTFKPGGRIKLDVIRDFKPIGSEDSFDPRTIPVDDTEGTNSNVHAKETRLNLDMRGMVEDQELRMYVETDFYGTSSVLRLRHAYGSYGGLLAGQTWSTFVDEDNMPRTIDFESPTAFPSVRQAQARWTQKLTESVTWSAAVEDNKSAIVIPTGIPGKAEYPMPDLVTRFRFDLPRGHVSTALFLGAARFRPADEDDDPDSVTLWGWMASVKLTTWGRDYGYAVFTTGDGIGRYRGGTTAVPDENNRLHAVGGVALMGGYEHFWSERWSTNATFSVADTSEEDFFDASVNERLTYSAVNLLYWFLGDRAWTGVEYLHGHRDVFGGANDDGGAHRLHYAVRFNFP